MKSESGPPSLLATIPFRVDAIKAEGRSIVRGRLEEQQRFPLIISRLFDRSVHLDCSYGFAGGRESVPRYALVSSARLIRTLKSSSRSFDFPTSPGPARTLRRFGNL